MDAATRPRSAPAWAGRSVLTASGLGFPLTQWAIRAAGRPGAVAVAGVSGGLLVRDLVLVARGAVRRLRTLPAALLMVEAGIALGATAAGLRLLSDDDALERAVDGPPDAAEVGRRVLVGALFLLHTWRFGIYLSPDKGRRAST